MQCFHGVTMGLPAGPHRAGSDWRGMNWVMWSTGDLRIDQASLAVVFSPAGSGRLAAKPLGCLLSAAAIMADDGGRVFVVNTNDSVHSLIRCSFRCRDDEQAFVALAQAAEKAQERRRISIPAADKGAHPGGAGGRCLDDGVAERIATRHPGQWPLVFGGAELYGPDPYSKDQDTEVLLGRGAVVLVDPQEIGRIGTYELLFYEESSLDQPQLRLPIGPRMKLEESVDDCAAAAIAQSGGGRMSLARRCSMARPGVVAAFDLLVQGDVPRAIAFDSEADAAAFRRDFNVRQRLVHLSLRTWRGMQALDSLQEEFYALQEAGLLPTLRRWTFNVLMLVVVAVLAHAVALYASAPTRPQLNVVLLQSLREARSWFFAFGTAASEAGTNMCNLVTTSMPVDAVQRCASLPPEVGESAVRRCLTTLVGRATGVRTA